MNALRVVLRIVLPLLVLAGGVLVARRLIEKRAQSGLKPPAALGVLVETTPVARSTRPNRVVGFGTVGAAREVSLQPQVSGRILEVHPALVPGGRVPEGALLVRIESADYDLQVAQARTQVETARQSLELEKGRRAIAEREWKSLAADRRDKADTAARGRALRDPQIRQAEAALDAANAALRQARLNVTRSRIEAPFNALVQTESVEVGQVVGPGAPAARLVGTDVFWVTVTVPLSELRWLEVPGHAGGGATAAVGAAAIQAGEAFGAAQGGRAVVRVDTGQGLVEREGRVSRLLGDLDPLGRQARVVVEVPDPLGLKNGAPPLLLGSYVEVEFEGRALDDVVEVPRAALREGDRAFVAIDGALEIRPLTVVRRLRDVVLVRAGLVPGEALITSRIATPIPGMKLRRLSELPAAPARGAAPPANGAPAPVDGAGDAAAPTQPPSGGPASRAAVQP